VKEVKFRPGTDEVITTLSCAIWRDS
jgi:hypothetical protein